MNAECAGEATGGQGASYCTAHVQAAELWSALDCATDVQRTAHEYINEAEKEI